MLQISSYRYRAQNAHRRAYRRHIAEARRNSFQEAVASITNVRRSRHDIGLIEIRHGFGSSLEMAMRFSLVSGCRHIASRRRRLPPLSQS